MFDLYAVQAAAAGTGAGPTFEPEDGYTESLHLGQYATALDAYKALTEADKGSTTRSTYADPGVKPPLWGHEVFQPGGSSPRCVARASGGEFAVVAGFAAELPGAFTANVVKQEALAAKWL